MEGNELSPHYLIAMKLAAYQSRRGGRKPAKIFLAPRMLLEINREPKCNYQASTPGEGKLFGIANIPGVMPIIDGDVDVLEFMPDGDIVGGYVDYILNIPSAAVGVGPLTVTSTAGTSSGETILSVSPMVLNDQSYLYKTDAEEITLPTEFGEVLSGWTPWNGVEPITATQGQYIAVAIVNGDNQAIYAGQTTVTANGGG